MTLLFDMFHDDVTREDSLKSHILDEEADWSARYTTLDSDDIEEEEDSSPTDVEESLEVLFA